MKSITILAALTLAFSLTANAAPWPESNDLHLQASAQFHNQNSYNYLDVAIKNPSAHSACILDATFNTQAPDLTIWDANNRGVYPKSAGNQRLDFFHGVNTAYSYDFAFPAQTFTRQIPMDNFSLKSGRYRYEVVIYYYICRDIVALDHAKPKDYLRPSNVIIRGSFTVP